MPIQIKDETVYILLKRLHEGDLKEQGQHELKLSEGDFVGREVTQAELLGTLDYLNQRGYINAKFSGNAYGNQEDVPDAVDPKEFDLRIANTYGSPDGPLPHVIAFETAELTEKGVQMLKEMEANPPQSLQSGPESQIADKDAPFLEKVMLKGGFEDIYDARDFTEVVFRIMRDTMTTEAADNVAEELHTAAEPTENKALQGEIVDLWKDTNPLVGWLSRVRPPWKGPGIFNIDSDRFLFRAANESPKSGNVDREVAVKAVFSATKEEMSQERVQEVAGWLPEGRVRELWGEA